MYAINVQLCIVNGYYCKCGGGRFAKTSHTMHSVGNATRAQQIGGK